MSKTVLCVVGEISTFIKEHFCFLQQKSSVDSKLDAQPEMFIPNIFSFKNLTMLLPIMLLDQRDSRTTVAASC